MRVCYPSVMMNFFVLQGLYSSIADDSCLAPVTAREIRTSDTMVVVAGTDDAGLLLHD